MVYDLDAQPRNPTNNSKLKNCLFGAASVVENNDKEKYVYSGYGITFESAGSCSFDNDTDRNFIFLVLIIVHHLMLTITRIILKWQEKVQLLEIMQDLVHQKKSLLLTLIKQTQFFLFFVFYFFVFIIIIIIIILSLHYNRGNTYLFVNGKEIFKFKASNKNDNFPTRFCLGSISNAFSAIDSSEMEMCMIFQSITILLINTTY